MSENNVNTGDARALFRFRTRSENVKCNQKSQYQYGNLNCPLCEHMAVTQQTVQHLDDQENLLHCDTIRQRCPEIRFNKTCQYSDIFGEDVDKMRQTVKLLQLAMKIRNEILENIKR